MKFKIQTQKKVRLVFFQYSFPDIFIEGKNVKEVINRLLTDPTYLNYYVESYPACVFKIYEYEKGVVPRGAAQWNWIEENEDDLSYVKLVSDAFKNDAKVSSIAESVYSKIDKTMSIYFNQKILMEVEQVDMLIKKHRGYKNAMKLVDQLQKQKKRHDEENSVNQERIKKENEIFMLAKMMSNNKDFKKMLREASVLQRNISPDMKLTMISPEAVNAYSNSILSRMDPVVMDPDFKKECK